MFGGLGDDIVLGTDGRLVVQGNEGNDWLESGIHGDLLQGDNADQQQNDTLGGDDVIIGGGNIDDVEGEGGDDIIVGRESGTTRFLGNLGFDWVTLLRRDRGAQHRPDRSSSSRPVKTRSATASTSSRQSRVEPATTRSWARSWTATSSQPEDAIFHKLTERALDLVDGFEPLLRPAAGVDYSTPFLSGRPTFDPLVPELTNQVMLGGAGSDVINGRGGSDFIDGDSVLQVAARVSATSGSTAPRTSRLGCSPARSTPVRSTSSARS